MEKFTEISEKIKVLKEARQILNEEYQHSEFHKKKEENPQDSVPPAPEDEEAIKLLGAIHQVDVHIKKLQDEQLSILKKNE
jgi:hypothetical protein